MSWLFLHVQGAEVESCSELGQPSASQDSTFLSLFVSLFVSHSPGAHPGKAPPAPVPAVQGQRRGLRVEPQKGPQFHK